MEWVLLCNAPIDVKTTWVSNPRPLEISSHALIFRQAIAQQQQILHKQCSPGRLAYRHWKEHSLIGSASLMRVRFYIKPKTIAIDNEKNEKTENTIIEMRDKYRQDMSYYQNTVVPKPKDNI